jgi:hypothetical protein
MNTISICIMAPKYFKLATLSKGITPWFLVRKRTIPTERPQPVGEVGANFSW